MHNSCLLMSFPRIILGHHWVSKNHIALTFPKKGETNSVSYRACLREVAVTNSRKAKIKASVTFLCGRRNNVPSPKDIHALNPGTCQYLSYKAKELLHVIKLRTWREKAHPELSNHMSS